MLGSQTGNLDPFFKVTDDKYHCNHWFIKIQNSFFLIIIILFVFQTDVLDRVVKDQSAAGSYRPRLHGRDQRSIYPYNRITLAQRPLYRHGLAQGVVVRCLL